MPVLPVRLHSLPRLDSLSPSQSRLWHIMLRFPFLVAGLIVIAATANAQAPPEPTITLEASATGGGAVGTDGTVTVSGNINLPPGWKLSIHTLTIRYQKQPGVSTLNAFASVKGAGPFKLKLDMRPGAYSVWAVIDVKDSEGREKQISSPPRTANVN
jgi:hypothetical protein